MELRIFFRCDKVIDKNTKQTIWKGPSETQFTFLQLDPMNILYSFSKLRLLKQQVFLKLQEEYFAKRLAPPNSHIIIYRCKMEYEDEMSNIYGITNVDTDTPSNNKHILIKHDVDGRYAELYITITLAIQHNND